MTHFWTTRASLHNLAYFWASLLAYIWDCLSRRLNRTTVAQTAIFLAEFYINDVEKSNTGKNTKRNGGLFKVIFTFRDSFPVIYAVPITMSSTRLLEGC